MNTMTDTDAGSLILTGGGYSLSISPEATLRKVRLLDSACQVLSVTSNYESANAQRVSRTLGQMRIEVEKARKAVKEPVNRVGNLIDQVAKDFMLDVEAEERRIQRLVGEHAECVVRAKEESEERERAAFDAARAAREAAEDAAEAASESGTIADRIAATKAQAARLEALTARMDASAEVADAKVADGVRFVTDYEVVDINLLADRKRELVWITPARLKILALLKDLSDDGQDIVAEGAEIGLRVFKKSVVSSR